MIKKLCCLTAGLAILTLMPLAAQQSKPEEKAPATRTLKIKLNYTGAGTVDAKHRITVFLFDTPDFMAGNVMFIAKDVASAKDAVVTFSGLTTSPIYAAAAFDPAGDYDGESGPPPQGSSVGIFSKTPGVPAPIDIEPGKTVQVELAFDDTIKMP